MRVIKNYFVLIVFVFTGTIGWSQPTGWNDISLTDLEAFEKPAKNWILSSDASADFTKPGDIKPIAGKGAVVNNIMPANNSHLVTKANYGDMQLELDFMMARNSNSGIFMQGRYEIQLFDSWTKLTTTFTDLHQRTPLFIGSSSMIKDLEHYLLKEKN